MARQTPLVCQHLENISRQALEKYQNLIRQYVRGRHGVYALYRGRKLYYVGLATNLRTRLGHHLKDRHAESWDRFSVYLTIGDSHLRELESLLLRIATPKGNKQKGKLPHSEDLRHRFTRDAKRSWQLEMQDLLGLSVARKKPAAQPVTPDGRQPILAAYANRPTKLRARFKGQTMISRQFNDMTVQRGDVLQLSPKVDPDNLGVVIPPDFKGEVLGLWRFHNRPEHPAFELKIPGNNPTPNHPPGPGTPLSPPL